MPKVVVVGQGYVGLPLAMRAVAAGHDVTGYEVDSLRAKRLADGDSYVDDITSEDVSRALQTGRYHPTSDPSECSGFEFAVITVPTPLRDGAPNLTYVESAAEVLGAHVTPGATVILESTTYPGTTEEVLVPILERACGLQAGTDFHVGYSPERIDPGNQVWRFDNTPKVVSGINPAALESVDGFYRSLVETTVPVSAVAVAESAKLLENTFRHVNIALVNEFAMFARDLGIDIWEVVQAAATKPFGYMPFHPGPGVGGHCLPIDPSYLSWRVERRLGSRFQFVGLANDINEHMPRYVVQRVLQSLNRRGRAVNGSRVLVLGLAYKRNSGDVRESPSWDVIDQLLSMGADVQVADPYVEEAALPEGAEWAVASKEAAGNSDIVILLTDHDRFDLDEIQAAAPLVFDTRHKMRGANVEYL